VLLDLMYCTFLFTLLGGLWLLNRSQGIQSWVPALRWGMNLLGGIIALGVVFSWLQAINLEPYQPILRPGTSKLFISSREWGKTWPLRVPSGQLECLNGQEIVFHTQGKTYAVNGIAKLKKYPVIENLAEPDQYLPKARKDLSHFQAIGLRLCR
jgi:hypothetical protein